MATDGTQYLIELAAKFSSGDAAVTKLADLGDRMLKAGATAKDLELATKATAGALEAAGAAAKSAADAVSDGETKYAAAERAAERAAKAVERIGAMADGQVGKLQAALDTGDAKKIAAAESRVWALAQRQQDAVEKSNAAASALKTEASALDGLSAKAATAAHAHSDMTKGLANVKAAADKAAKAEAAASGSGKVNEMAEAFGKLGGPAGVAGQKVLGFATGFKKLGAAMGSAGPYVAIAVAIVAIAAAAGVAAVAISSWGIKLADTNRTQGLLMDGIARTSAGGAELADTIDRIGAVVPSTRAELMDMAKGLADSGLRGKALSSALEVAAVKAAKLKFGPDFQAQMLSLDFQSKRFGENLASTFGGLKIEPLLSGIQTLGALFDSGTASGRALKFLFESMFQPLIDGAAGAIPKIERLFLYAEILALKAYIALKPYRGEIEAVGRALLIGAAVLGGVMAVAIGVVVGLLGVMMAMVLDLSNTIYEWVGAFLAVGSAIYGAFASAVAFMTDIGGQMIDGLIGGITSKATAVVDAITGVVKGGIAAVENFLQIGSPSKLMAGIGGHTAEGFAEGVDSGAGDAQGALAAMVAPPAGGGAGARAGGGVSLSIGQIVLGAGTAKEQADEFIDHVTAWLEGEGLTLGGGEVPA
jgi:hypothetical protein